jgi:hypothetical protein
MSKTHTTNGAIALSSTGNCLVDFFVILARNVETETLLKYLPECWSIDPKMTLAIILNARDRQKGKKEKNASNRCMIWLKRNKFNTYAKNILTYINKYGCWKDINYIAIKNPLNNEYEIELFSNQLKIDKENLENNKNVSLCAKWVSSQNDKYDKNNQIAQKIATLLVGNYAKKMEIYRKNYIIPLRKEIDIVESYMTSNKWININYDKVPSIAMKRYNNTFRKHDPDGYQKYINSIISGNKKMKITGILPHELVKYYLDGNEYNETIELQWNAILADVKESGVLKNMLAIADVSGSMYESKFGNVQPIYPCIALSILVAKCVEGNFSNKIISFSESPTIYNLKGDNLYEQIKDIMANLPMGFSTNFEAVFDMLIDLALTFNISSEEMPKNIICFTDMQFNEAINSQIDKGSTDQNLNILHESIIKKYEEINYSPPKFIYWNLNGASDGVFPVSTKTENVAIISGFSEQLLKVFMTSSVLNIENIMYELIAPYLSDVVIDEDDI